MTVIKQEGQVSTWDAEVSTAVYILIKIDLIRYRSFYQIQVLIQFFVGRSERTLKTGNVLKQKSGILFKLEEIELSENKPTKEEHRKTICKQISPTSTANFLAPLPLKNAYSCGQICLCRINFQI